VDVIERFDIDDIMGSWETVIEHILANGASRGRRVS
jgi:hypothetical protein